MSKPVDCLNVIMPGEMIALSDLSALKADIDEGLADLTAGRVKAFDADRIIARGKQLLAARSS